MRYGVYYVTLESEDGTSYRGYRLDEGKITGCIVGNKVEGWPFFVKKKKN